ISEMGANQNMSDFERLPKELVREIIERAPESIFNLRLTSRVLKSLVDDYASSLKVKIHVVDHLCITSFENQSENNIQIVAHVPKSHADLFELRIMLKFRSLPFDANSRIVRSFGRLPDHPNLYRLTNSLFDDGTLSLIDCIGPLIRRVSLYDYMGNKFKEITKKLEGFEFRKMAVTLISVSNNTNHHHNGNHPGSNTDNDVDTLMETVKAHNLDHVSLSVDRISKNVQAKILIELSKLVHSIFHTFSEVSFCPYGLVPGSDSRDDRPELIMDIFSSGTFNTLVVDNRSNPPFLSTNGANILKQHLPILGKKIWFESTCDISTGCRKETINGHVVEVFMSDGKRLSLKVKHSSRMTESHEYF
ncbi:hypothetical protein PENTCL1PPCAC_18807, partial [Pristionchus entomophagus]